MQLYGALVLLVTLSAACGLRCHVCQGKSCTNAQICLANTDRCATAEVNGVIHKGCVISDLCEPPVNCCKTDLCNSAIPTGSSVLLLLVSSAIMTVFL